MPLETARSRCRLTEDARLAGTLGRPWRAEPAACRLPPDLATRRPRRRNGRSRRSGSGTRPDPRSGSSSIGTADETQRHRRSARHWCFCPALKRRAVVGWLGMSPFAVIGRRDGHGELPRTAPHVANPRRDALGLSSWTSWALGRPSSSSNSPQRKPLGDGVITAAIARAADDGEARRSVHIARQSRAHLPDKCAAGEQTANQFSATWPRQDGEA